MNPDENEFLGVTDDFFWYELTEMAKQLHALAERFKNMERVLKARSYEQNTYVHFLQQKMQEYKVEAESLRGKK
jgi:nicotinic acid phosphoribosyltransferase